MSGHSGRGEGLRNAAIYPARAAARAWRGPLESAAEDILSSPEVGRVIDRAMAGPLAEELARSLVRHHVVERVVQELVEAGELERLLDSAVNSPRSVDLVDRVVASEAFRHALERTLSGPELQAAITARSSGLAEQVAGKVRSDAASLDVRVHRGSAATPAAFAGVASRGLALVVDALAVAVLSLLLGGAVGVVSSLVGGIKPHSLAAVLLGAGGVIVAGGYFTLFWSAVGQTPGMRLAGVHVWGPRADGRLTAGRAVVRTLGLALAIIPCFLGFLPALFDSRRRALPDYLANTVVRYDDEKAR
jgi:uncharacterized RDD family membrane protein YckC